LKEIIKTDAAPQAIGPYSQGVKVGDIVFFSGQIALDHVTGQLHDGDCATQTEIVMRNISALLVAAGLDFTDVVKSTIFLTDLTEFVTVNTVYGKYFTENPPARSTVEVKGLPRGAKVEIEIVAYAKRQ
jgi:2-iminobutanoate/2-iminopropanoate deaminase